MFCASILLKVMRITSYALNGNFQLYFVEMLQTLFVLAVQLFSWSRCRPIKSTTFRSFYFLEFSFVGATYVRAHCAFRAPRRAIPHADGAASQSPAEDRSERKPEEEQGEIGRREEG